MDLQDTLASAARLACKILRGDIAAVALADEEGMLTIRAHVGLVDECAARWHVRAGDGPFGSVCTRGRPHIITDSRYLDELAPEASLRAMLLVPLKSGKSVIGCFGIGYKRERKLTKRDLQLASLFASYASIGIETAALFERERMARRRSDALLNVVETPRPGLGLKSVLTKLCRSVLKLSNGQRCAIFILSEDGQNVEALLSLGGEFPVRWSTTIPYPLTDLRTPKLEAALEEGNRRPVIEEHATSPGLVAARWLERFKVKSIAAYPMACRQKRVGLLVVYSYSDYVSFPPEEVATISAIAKQAAVLIENARLYERERRQRQRSDTLARMLTAASSTLSLRQACVKVCEAALALTVGDNIAIFLSNNQRNGFTPLASVGGEGGTEETRTFLSPPREIMSSAQYRQQDRMLVRLRKPYAADDASTSLYTHRWWIDVFGLKSIAYYPLMIKGRNIGLMTVTSMKEQRKFSRDEIETLNAIAKHAAVIIENARLYEHEQRLRQRSDTLAKMLAAASSTLSFHQVCAKVCEAALELTVGDTVSIFLQREGSQSFMPVSARGRGGREEPERFRSPPPEVQASPGLSLFDRMLAKRRKPYTIEDVANSPQANTWWMKSFHLKSLAYYPLRAKGKMIGFMCVAAVKEKRRFSQEEVDALSVVARQGAMIIENARLYEQQQAQRQRAEGLVNVLTATASTLSLKTVLAKLCQAVVDISVGDRVSIFMMAEDGNHLEPVMSLGLEDPNLWEKFRNPRPGFEFAPESMQLFQSVTTLEEPLITADATSSPLLDKWWIDTFNIKSIAQYPLRVKDRTIGMMTVDSFRHRVHFPKEEVETMAAIAQQAAVIIENARVYEGEQQQRKRAEALVDVLTTAASALGLNKVLVKICQTAVDISVAERCSVFVMDKEGRLKPMMSLGVEDPEAWERFRNAQALAGATAITLDLRQFYGKLATIDEPVVIEDAPSSSLIPKWWLDAFQVKSLVHYPLRIKEKTIGLMTLDSFHEPAHFPKEEIETLAAIARQAAVVIENARLHEQLQEQAITDHLTGLFNHRHVHSRLEEEFARAGRSNSDFAVMMMDVDKFKDINDTHGHLQGDEALRFISRKLRDTVRSTDIVGRYGGDEFLAILPNTTREEAQEVSDRIMAALAGNPFPLGGSDHSVTISMSIGIACYPKDSANLDELVMLADSALYEVKRMGGGRAMPVSSPEFGAPPSQSLGFGLLQGLLNAIAHKDPYTRRHCEDNVRYVDMIADRLNLGEQETESLRKAALLHDVGKIAIPDQTLLKPGPLNSDEWEVMQQHVRFGEMIVKGIAQISDAIEPVATHHERYDGKGYPRGLKGEAIPLLGRILAVVDAYSAMTLDRPYRNALPEREAIKELVKGSGTQFDPDVVQAFLKTLRAAHKPQKKVA